MSRVVGAENTPSVRSEDDSSNGLDFPCNSSLRSKSTWHCNDKILTQLERESKNEIVESREEYECGGGNA